MNEKLKKVLIIIIFLIIVVVLALALYYFFFKPPVTDQGPGYRPITPSTGQLPSTIEGNVNRIIPTNINAILPVERIPEEKISKTARGSYTKVSTVVRSKITAPQITPNGDFNYYNASEGRFYRVSADGKVSKLSDTRFFAVENITWSPDSERAVLEYPDKSNIIYDFTNDRQYSLPKELQDFDFSKNSKQLGAEVIGPREENNWIVTSNADGTNIEFVERLGSQADDVDINWSPNSQVVALYRKNISASNQEIIFVGRHQENFKSLVTYGRGFEGQWTTKGDRLLYSVFKEDDNFMPTLWAAEASGNRIGLNNIDTGINTWSYKCTVAGDNATAYCGVPNSLPAGSGVYPELANDTSDSFYKVDLHTGNSSLIALPIGETDEYRVDKIFLSSDESVLYFQDVDTGYLHSIDLE